MDAATLAQAKVDAAKRYGPTKVGAYSFGGGGANSDTTAYTEAAMRLPFRLTVSPTRFRVHVANRDYKGDTTKTGTISFTGLWLGEHSLSTSTASGNHYTGGYVAAPVQIDPAFTVVDNGEHVSAWIDPSTMGLTKDTFYLLSTGFTCASGQTIVRNYGCMYFTNTAGDAAKAGQTAALGSFFNNPGLFDVWIEYEFKSARPVGLFIGDSITEGRSAASQAVDALGSETSYPQQWARRAGGVAVINAYSGITLGSWALINSTKWGRFPTIVPDFVHVEPLTNDIGNNVDSLTTMKTNYLSVLNKIRTLYGPKVPIYGATITPRGLAGTQETNRTSLNAWLRALPGNLAGVTDFDRAVRNPTTPASLDADFDSGDTLHLNSGGYAKLAREIGGGHGHV